MKKPALFAAYSLWMCVLVVAQDRPREPEKPKANQGGISFSSGVDLTTEYWFRGIGQQNQGLIAQPFTRLDAEVFSDQEARIGVFAGIWNSVHSEADDSWYEADFYAGVSFNLPKALRIDLSYVNLYNPAGNRSFAEEIDILATWDDSRTRPLGLSLAPYAALAFEVSGGSDAGQEEGTYLEIGIKPAAVIAVFPGTSVSLSFPVSVGMSLENYYENSQGESDAFGFADAGIEASLPLDIVPQRYGAWKVNLGVHFVQLGRTATQISEGDEDHRVYLKVGFNLTY